MTSLECLQAAREAEKNHHWSVALSNYQAAMDKMVEDGSWDDNELCNDILKRMKRAYDIVTPIPRWVTGY